jgi:hypothetical protein
VGADGDQSEERVGARADDREVAGGFVDHQEHWGNGTGVGGGKAHGGGGSAHGDGYADATIDDVEGNDTAGDAVANVHLDGFGREDTGGGSETEEHGVAHFVCPGVDDLQAVGIGGDDVEFAAIGFEEHLRGIAGEVEIGDEHGALKIDDAKAFLRAAGDEGQLGIGHDQDFVGLGDDRDGAEELESAGVVDRKQRRAAVDDENIFGVGRDARLNRLGIRVRAAVDLARGGVERDELVGTGGGGVDAIAGRGEVDGVGCSADGNAGELVGTGVEDEGVVAAVGDAPDFGAEGMFAEVADGGADGNFGNRVEGDEVDHGERAVIGGDVGVHTEVGAEEGRTMVPRNDEDGAHDKQGGEKENAEVSNWRHGMK